MTDPNQRLGPPEQPPFTHQQAQQVLHAGVTLDQIPGVVHFASYFAAELDTVRGVAEEGGYSPSHGEAALIGVALGAAANSPEKGQIFRDHFPRLMDELAKTGIDEEDKSFIGTAVRQIANSGANTGVILHVTDSIESYAAYREKEGGDAKLVRTTMFAMGFGASTKDRALKMSMADQLQKQVTQR